MLPEVWVHGNAGTGEAECVWISDPGFKQREDILSLDELNACYADLNELAITLGRLSGCVVQ